MVSGRMSPIALTSPTQSSVETQFQMISGGGKGEISRRPSPWTDLAHSLSETSVPAPKPASNPIDTTPASNPSPALIPSSTPPTSDIPHLSSSALREWDRRLLESSSQVKRHHLIHPNTLSSLFPNSPSHQSTSATLRHISSNGAISTPKLAAERDKEGHIEYKLKLIEPTPDRFERLVTQMLWRLKQGRNEAIYEFGLADDGTVIGLTRTEMDASLHTLEQMAAEVGATVLILKEIVLCPAPPRSYGPSSASSSALSLSSDSGWMARRPDLDERGLPRRGSRSISNGAIVSGPVIGSKVSNGGGNGMGSVLEGRMDKAELRVGENQMMGDRSDLVSTTSGRSLTSSSRVRPTDEGDDEPPFHLELDLNPDPTPPQPISRRKWKRHFRSTPLPHPKGVHKPLSPEVISNRQEKARIKAVKSAERREARRLELYKGDGKDPMWIDRLSTVAASSVHPALSTLRLVTPSTVPSVDNSPTDPSFLADLLAVPLDNLSLSFAEVRTVVGIRSTPSSSSTDDDEDEEGGEDGDEDGDDDLGSSTEYATSPPIATHIPQTSGVTGAGGQGGIENGLGIDRADEGIAIPQGSERICVEALVVRKTAEGVAGVVEWCDDGDDVWGFGYGAGDGEGEEAGDVDPEDGWGFEG